MKINNKNYKQRIISKFYKNNRIYNNKWRNENVKYSTEGGVTGKDMANSE